MASEQNESPPREADGAGAFVTDPDDDRLTTAENSLWLFVAQALGILATSVVAIVAVRNFSTASWGRYASAMALVAVGSVFANSGVGFLALREMSTQPGRQGEILGLSFAVVGVSAIVVSALLVPIAVALGFSSVTIVLVALALPLCFLQPGVTLLVNAFNARRALHLAARFQFVQYTVYCGGAIALIISGVGPAGVVVANVVSLVLALVAAMVRLQRRFRLRIRLPHDPRPIWRFARAAAPLASIGIASVVYERVDVVMLASLRGPLAVARYTVPYSLITLSAVVPSVISAAFFPALNETMSESPQVAPAAFLFVVRLFLLLSVPIALFLGFAGARLLPLLFTARYAHTADILAVLAAGPVIAFQIYAFWYVMLSAHQERPFFRIRVYGLGLNVVVNAILIPLFGPVGAAASWILAEAFVAVTQVVTVHRHIFPVPATRLLTRPTVALVAAVIPAGIAAAMKLPLVAGVAAAVVYAGLLFLTRYVQPRELVPVLHALRAMAGRRARVG